MQKVDGLRDRDTQMERRKGLTYCTIRFLGLATMVALPMCAPTDPAAYHAEREAQIAEAFPDEADRAGLYLVNPKRAGGFPSRLEILYFPDEVTKSQLLSRADRYCEGYALQGAAGRAVPTGDDTSAVGTLEDGSQRTGRYVTLDCVIT